MIWTILVGVAVAQDCPAMDVDQQAERAVVALTGADFELAERLADEGLSILSCAPRVVDPQDVATLWQVKGAVGVYSQDMDKAEQALAQAAAVYPDWFNERLGAPVQGVWSEQVATLGEPVTLTVWPLPDESSLYVDGIQYQDPRVPLHPGVHLVQVADGADVLFAQELTLSAGQPQRVDTLLPEPENMLPSRLPWVLGGIAGLSAAGASYGVALSLRDDMELSANKGDPEGVTDVWQRHVAWGYVAAPTLALAGVGTAALGMRRRAKAQAEAEAFLESLE